MSWAVTRRNTHHHGTLVAAGPRAAKCPDTPLELPQGRFESPHPAAHRALWSSPPVSRAWMRWASPGQKWREFAMSPNSEEPLHVFVPCRRSDRGGPHPQYALIMVRFAIPCCSRPSLPRSNPLHGRNRSPPRTGPPARQRPIRNLLQRNPDLDDPVPMISLSHRYLIANIVRYIPAPDEPTTSSARAWPRPHRCFLPGTPFPGGTVSAYSRARESPLA